MGRYVVLDAIGAGGMGVVYAAFDPELDRKIALKLLHRREAGPSEAPERNERLLREARAIAKLSHPNVIAVHDVGEHDGRVYVAMEFVDGQTLGQWAKEGPHGWRSVLDIYRQAGEGLAAAHARGLIHRDFKPDNVMVGADGRVRVMDFGLARPTGTERPEAGSGDDDGSRTSDTERSERSRLSRMAGTPAYMAPEQHFGLELGPASDQFSFCVALWEALYDGRPFTGDSAASLAFSVAKGNPRESPSANVPGWTRRALTRGLAADADERYPSMRALLVELSKGQARARMRQAVAAVAIAGLLGAGAIGYDRYQHLQRVTACEDAAAAIDEAWNETARQRLRDSLLATEVSYAEDAVDRALPWLDNWARSWSRTREKVCLASTVEGLFDAGLSTRAGECLDERRMQFETLVEELSNADKKAAHKSVDAAASLPAVEPCAEERYLGVRAAMPQGARDEVREVRSLLAQARSLDVAGRYDSGLELAKEATSKAQALQWPALVAESRARRGMLLSAMGQYEAAERELSEAYVEAAKEGAPEVAATAAVKLIGVVGMRQRHHEEGFVWARAAEVAVQAVEPEGGLRTADRLLGLAAMHHRGTADYKAAKSAYDEALGIFEQELGPQHPRVSVVLNNLAHLTLVAGDREGAKALYQRALKLREETLGPNHPNVANTLMGLAVALQSGGEYAEARALTERTLAIQEKALGPEHPNLAIGLNNLANFHLLAGEHGQAEQLFARTLRIKENAFGPEHPEVGATLSNIAATQHARGDLPQAKATYQRALGIKERAQGLEHPDVASTLQGLADVHRALGERDEARAAYERALVLLEKSVGLEHVTLAYSLSGLAELALLKSNRRDAVSLAERSLKVRDAAGAPPTDVAESRFLLARSLDAGSTDRERALRLAAQAAETYRKNGDNDALARVETWLSERGG